MYRESLKTLDPDHDLDAVHDAVVALLERGLTENDPRLYVTAQHKGLDEVRRRQRQAVLTDEPETLPDKETADPALLSELAERKALIHTVVGRLTVDLRQVIFRRYWLGEPVNTIAAALGIAPPTVYGRLHRAHEQLEEWLKSYDMN
jgi:RNA polymerase sigma factor (sigma-70 family)